MGDGHETADPFADLGGDAEFGQDSVSETLEVRLQRERTVKYCAVIDTALESMENGSDAKALIIGLGELVSLLTGSALQTRVCLTMLSDGYDRAVGGREDTLSALTRFDGSGRCDKTRSLTGAGQPIIADSQFRKFHIHPCGMVQAE